MSLQNKWPELISKFNWFGI